ncbi:MAG: hypothetical protein ACYCY0_08080 [Acidithiobacillus ferrivorans]
MKNHRGRILCKKINQQAFIVLIRALVFVPNGTSTIFRSLRTRSEGDVGVLQLAREATALLAEALGRIGDPYVLCGFDYNGRHDVEFCKFKDFGTFYDDKVKGRLADMTGQLSTRMGATLRHAGHLLDQHPSQKTLILF